MLAKIRDGGEGVGCQGAPTVVVGLKLGRGPSTFVAVGLALALVALLNDRPGGRHPAATLAWVPSRVESKVTLLAGKIGGKKVPLRLIC